ncbi:hypothetical protein ABGB14_11485 [Nonomuraea sp. B10E15]|uniref:hypothetical protein n=1 Tax=Nonomuraea sp. B10E15 TaxID=3153560 RepID=UPI00325E6995
MDLARGATPAMLTEQMRNVLTEKLSDRTAAELELQIDECLKFLTITSVMQENFFPLSKEVDEVWHELISETGEYQRLCDRLPGRRFLHHSAITLAEYAQQRDTSTVVKQLLDWIPNYVHYFGDYTEESARHWTICEFLRNELGLSLDEINQIGRNSARSIAAEVS